MSNITQLALEVESLRTSLALQQEQIDAAQVTSDNVWILGRAFTVLTMQAGFAMLEAGLVSTRSTSNILAKNLADMAVGAIGFYIIGWGLAYGPPADGAPGWLSDIMGTSQFLFIGVTDEWANIVFQWTFAATSTTIVSGAVAGRIKFVAYVWLAWFQTTLVYPLVAHWVWDAHGWLFKLGVVDLAGDLAVHMLGGVVGLVATVYMGPRKGVFSPSGKYLPLRSSPLNAAFGGLILWWCWFAFNAGSTLGVSGGVDVLAAIVSWNTAIAAGAAVAAALALSFYRSAGRFVDIFDVVTGLLAGLVGITAGAHVVTSWAALIIGGASGVAAIFMGEWLATLGVDDPVGAVPVHVGAAVVGMLLTGLFALPVSEGRGNTYPGEFYGGDGTLIGVQLLAVLVILAFGTLAGIAQVLLVDRIVGGLRVSSAHEEQGLDKSEHNLVQIRVSNHMDGLDISDSDNSDNSDEEGDDFDATSPSHLPGTDEHGFTNEGKKAISLGELANMQAGGGNGLFDEGGAPGYAGGAFNLLASKEGGGPVGGGDAKKSAPALLKELMGSSNDLAGFLLDDGSSMMGTVSDRSNVTGRSGVSDARTANTMDKHLARIFGRDSASVRSLASIHESGHSPMHRIRTNTSDEQSSGRPPRGSPSSPKLQGMGGVGGAAPSPNNKAIRTAYGTGGIYYGSKRTGGRSSRRADAAKLLTSMQKQTHKKTVKQMKSSQAKLAKQLLRLTAEMILERTQDDIAWVPMHQLDAFQQNYAAVSAADGAHSALTVEQMHPSVKKLQDHARRKSIASTAMKNAKRKSSAAAAAAGAGFKTPPAAPATAAAAAAAGASGGGDSKQVPPQDPETSISNPLPLPDAEQSLSSLEASAAPHSGRKQKKGLAGQAAVQPAVSAQRKATTNSSGLSDALFEELELDDTSV